MYAFHRSRSFSGPWHGVFGIGTEVRRGARGAFYKTNPLDRGRGGDRSTPNNSNPISICRAPRGRIQFEANGGAGGLNNSKPISTGGELAAAQSGRESLDAKQFEPNFSICGAATGAGYKSKPISTCGRSDNSKPISTGGRSDNSKPISTGGRSDNSKPISTGGELTAAQPGPIANRPGPMGGDGAIPAGQGFAEDSVWRKRAVAHSISGSPTRQEYSVKKDPSAGASCRRRPVRGKELWPRT